MNTNYKNIDVRKTVNQIIITGGPCAGKTSILCSIKDWAIHKGIVPIFIDEISTRLQSSGIYPNEKSLGINDFEKLLIKTQLNDEENYVNAAIKISKKLDRNVLIIQDRGILDVSAYVGFEQFEIYLKELGKELKNEIPKYLAAIHLVTAANGAIHAYTTDNNPARIETPEEAKILDNKIYNAYINTLPTGRVYRIPNQGNFERKKLDTINVLNNIFNFPLISEKQKKYLLFLDDAIKLSLKYTSNSALIKQTYLYNKNSDALSERKIRETINDTSCFYSLINTYYQRNNVNSDIERIKTELMLTKKEYEHLKKEASPKFVSIEKIRTGIYVDDVYMEIDQFLKPQLPYAIAEIKSFNEGFDPCNIKSLTLGNEITNDFRYFNKNIARL